MHQLFTWVVEPGFFTSEPVRTAAVLGGVVEVVSCPARKSGSAS